ncbi:hypothetical protein N5C60_15185, partial [Pseudomonas mosselii]|nr:hypothetical protein [Pseudomonas mosselii]
MNTQAWIRAATALTMVMSLGLTGCSSGGGGHHSEVDGSSADGGTGAGTGAGAGDSGGGAGG